MGEKRRRKTRGILWRVLTVIAAIIMLAVLELGKHTIVGWVLTGALLAAYCVLRLTKLRAAGRLARLGAFCGMLVLFYYGYIFVVLFGLIVLRRNIGAFFILLCFFVPGLLFSLMILGFLYGSGPLRTYLETKAQALQK